MMTRRLGVVAVAVLTVALSSSFAFGEDDVVREARDRAEIDALMWRYVRALDTLNADAYAALYTADGQFGGGPTAPKGHDAPEGSPKQIMKTGSNVAASTGVDVS